MITRLYSSSASKLLPSAYDVAGRIAAVQLLCSRWGLESYHNVLTSEHGKGDISKGALQKLQTGQISISECSTLDELRGSFSEKELQLLNADIGSWKDSVSEYESYWESLATLLWSLRVFDKMSDASEWSRRAETYGLTGIMPSNPSSIMYWIKGFENVEEKDDSRHLRSYEDIYMLYRRTTAWRWRCFMYDLEMKEAKSVMEQSMIKNIPKGIKAAASRCLSDQLIEMTLDDDFVLSVNGDFRAFRDVDGQTVDRIKNITAGRVLGFNWLLKDQSFDRNMLDGMSSISTGVSAIWLDHAWRRMKLKSETHKTK